MTVLDRMILLLIDLSPDNSVSGDCLQSVCSVVNKRHALQLENGLNHFEDIMRSLCDLYLIRGPYGFRLDDNGKTQVKNMQQVKGTFCKRFKKLALPVFQTFQSRSSNHADVRVQVPRHQVWASI